MTAETFDVLERASSYAWCVTHVVGATVMFFGWRRYRQRFFGWLGSGWLLQAVGGIVWENKLDPVDGAHLCIRLGATTCGLFAIYYGIILCWRASSATQIVRVEHGGVRVRQGMQTRFIRFDDEIVHGARDDEDTLPGR